MIQNHDISIVVQGPILYQSPFGVTQETTRLVCTRLKKIFPQSEVVLSTWKGSHINSIPYDKLVLSEDPGATWFNYRDYKLLNNCSRLIVSTRAGIEAASRKYVFKIRSDLFVASSSFLHYFNQFPYYDEEYKFVKNRIIAFSLYSIKSHRTCLFTMKRPYHISDWAYFGCKEDLLDLYSIPLPREPAFSQWFLKRCKPFFDIEPHRLWKMPPEQYVTSSFFKKHTRLNFDHTNDLSYNNAELSDRLIANNFLVLDQTQFHLISLKYFNLQLLFDPLLSQTAIFYRTWLQDYYKFCRVPRTRQYIKHKIQMWRQWACYACLNRSLRFINKKNALISRLLAYLIKKFN